MPRVSVIVPTFNRVDYLEETIASILSQDYRDFELVVADNASTDGTAAMLAGVTDPRLHHVRRHRNIGWKANFNQALDSADSEFVTLVADDDRLLPGALTRAVRCLDEATRVGLVHTTFHLIDDRGEVISSDVNTSGEVAEDRIQRGSDFIAQSMASGSWVRLSSAVMRTAALPDVCFDPAEDVCEDFVLFIRIALDWDIGFLATPGIDLRVHPGQLSSAFDLTDGVRALQDSKLRFLEANSAYLEHAGALRRAALRNTAHAMSQPVSIAAHESRAEAFRALRRAVRFRPQLLLAPSIWRVAAMVILGPRILRRDLRRRPRFHHQ